MNIAEKFGHLASQLCPGAVLSAAAIASAIQRGELDITPYDVKNLGPNGYDVAVGDKVVTYRAIKEVDLHDTESFDVASQFTIPEEGFLLRPGNIYLISTKEMMNCWQQVPFLSGRSSVDRLGIMVAPSFCSIGHRGRFTLTVRVTYPTRIYVGDPIAQVMFFKLAGEHVRNYTGKYYDTRNLVESRWEV